MQTCTVEGSVGDVGKASLVQENKTWPGESKVRESRWWRRERRREHSNPLMHWRRLSVLRRGDVRPKRGAVAVNVKHQIDMIQRSEEVMKSVVAGELMRAKSCVQVLIPQSGVLRNVPQTIELTSQPTREEVRTFRRCQYRNNDSQSCRLCLSCFNAQRTTANTRHCSCCMSACLYAFSTIPSTLVHRLVHLQPTDDHDSV